MANSHKRFLADATEIQMRSLEEVKRIKRAKEDVAEQIEHSRKTLNSSREALKKIERKKSVLPDESSEPESD